MADLSVSNSGYSTGATDTWTAMVNNVTPHDARQPNGLASAILQIEAVLGSGSVLPGSLASLAARLAVQVGTDGIIIPPGAGMDYFGASAPTGWLFRDGSAVSRTTYAALFTAIGTTYGVGDGSTTFNLPDDRTRVTRGAGTGARDGESGSGAISGGTEIAAMSIGEWGGSTEMALEAVHNGPHEHQITVATDASGGGSSILANVDSFPAGTAVTESQGSGTAFSLHTPYLVCNKIIKT